MILYSSSLIWHASALIVKWLEITCVPTSDHWRDNSKGVTNWRDCDTAVLQQLYGTVVKRKPLLKMSHDISAVVLPEGMRSTLKPAGRRLSLLAIRLHAIFGLCWTLCIIKNAPFPPCRTGLWTGPVPWGIGLPGATKTSGRVARDCETKLSNH